MTKPEHVRHWWGILDERYSVPVCEIDLRVGGAWRFVGRDPTGSIGFHGVYREIVAPDASSSPRSSSRFPTSSRSSRPCSPKSAARRG